MNEKVYSLKDINGEQNFALATLCKQKECLKQWLKYLNVKNIYMPEEVEKYRKRIAELNNAIKILEEELNTHSDLSEKNFANNNSKQAKPAAKNKIPITSNNQSLIMVANVGKPKIKNAQQRLKAF